MWASGTNGVFYIIEPGFVDNIKVQVFVKKKKMFTPC